MSTIQKILEQSNPYRSLQTEAQKKARKWRSLGLLKGLTSETEVNNMAMILENQAKQLVIESGNMTQQGGSGFTTGTGETWAGIALPLVRKVFGQVAAKEFVSVQPMNLPSGLVFYLEFQYGNNKPPFVQGSSLYGNQGGNAPFGNIAEGGFYGAGRFGYSINQFSGSATTAPTNEVSWAELNFDSYFSQSVVDGDIYKISVPGASLENYDASAIRGFIVESGSQYVASNQLQAFTKVNGSNIDFFFKDPTGTGFNTGSSAFTVYYHKQTFDNNRGDFEDGSGYSTPNAASNESIVIPEINVKLQSEGIIAKTKKLKTVWTPEFAQDLNAYHSIDAEAELTNIMSEHVSLEIDLEVLEMLITGASAGTEYWSVRSNRFFDKGQDNFGQALDVNNGGYFNSQGQWFQTLGVKLQKLSNSIHQKTLRGGANFMVISPAVSTIIESIPGYASNNDGDVTKMKYAFGVQKTGQLNSRFTVYKNPYMTENLILLGYRGNQFLEAGAVFAPYVPLIMTPLVYDPDTFTPRKGLLTRYAKKMLRPEFYAKVYVEGLDIL